MPKFRLWWCSGLLAVVVLVCGTALGVMLKHEPNFYGQSHIPPSAERLRDAHECSSGFAQMGVDIKAHQENWHFNATEKQLDSFLLEAFPKFEQAERLRKLGLSDPIIALDDDCLRMAFRYGTGWFSTVISYDLQVWLLPKDRNAVAVKVLRTRAGAVPISSQTILNRLVDVAKDQNIDMTFYRHEGKSVAILKLGDPNNPSWHLTGLQVGKTKQGLTMLAINGRTPPHLVPPPMIALPKADAAPALSR